MKQENGKKSKKLLWIILAAVALLVAVAVALVMFLQPAESQEGEQGEKLTSEVYWNLDRLTFTENAEMAGFSDRKKSDDGLYHFRMASKGQLLDMATADKRLVNYMDTLDTMGLVLDADGLIVDAIDVKEIAVETAKSFYVKEVNGNTVTVNSSIAMNGLDVVVELGEGVYVMDVRRDTETPAQSVPFEVMDMVHVYGTEEKPVESVFLAERLPQSELYLRAERLFDSSTGKTTRVPDENGVYTITYMKDGKAIDLKCKDEALVTTIDSYSNDRQVMGLVFDEEGYITETIAAATAIRGNMICTYFNVTEINGDTVTATRLMSGSNQGQSVTFNMTENTQIVIGETGCCEYFGMLSDELKMNDRLIVWTDLENNALYVFVDLRTQDYPMVYLIGDRKYNNTLKETTRLPDENGYYVYEVACEGKVITVKTKSKEMASRVDSYSNYAFGLKREGSIIKATCAPTCVNGGYGVVGSRKYVAEVMGTIVRIVDGGDFENGGNYMIDQTTQIYDLTGAYGTKLGEKTTLQAGDRVVAYRSLSNVLTHVFVLDRYYPGLKLYWNYGRRYDAVKQETTRTPDADGYYVFDTFFEGKAVRVKTKSKAIASFVDKQNAPCVAMKVSNGIIKEAYPAASAVKYGQKVFNFRTVDSVKNGEIYCYYMSGGVKYEDSPAPLTSKCKIYNVSTIFDDHQGELTKKIKAGDQIQAIRNWETGDIEYIWIMNRKLNSPLYFTTDPLWFSGETTREPDADGYYRVDLFIDGKIKTFKTKDKKVMTAVDKYPETPFSMETNGDIILKAGPANSSKFAVSSASYMDVMKISGNKITVKDNREYSSNYGKEMEFTLSKDTKIYSVCGYSDHQYQKHTLKVGDRLFAYADQQGNCTYIFVNYEYNRKGAPVSECSHCGKEVFWEPFTGTIRTVDCHYYMPGDLNRGQVVIGKDANANPDAYRYSAVIDMNGKTFTSTTRNFLVYTDLTLIDSVGGGILEAVGYNGGDAGNMYIIGGTVNLYDGITLRKTAGAECQAGKGGNFYISNQNVKDDKGNITKTYIGTANIYNAVLEGWPVTLGSNISVGSGGGKLMIAGGTIKGGVIDPAVDAKISLSGKPKIEKLNLTSGAKIAESKLTAGASVKVSANGIFTEKLANAASQKAFYEPVLAYKPIEVRDNALWTEYDSTVVIIPELPQDSAIDNSNLTFTNGTMAECPVCKKEVEWFPVTQGSYGDTGIGNLAGGEHFYLDEDIVYEGEAAFVTAPSLKNGSPLSSCFHLNGHNVTSTNTTVITGYPGILNVMGNGTVSGGKNAANQGAAVTVNTSYATSTINLYGGTYTKLPTASAASVISIWANGGNIHLFEGAKVVGTNAGPAIFVSKSGLCNSSMIVKGASIEGGMLQVYDNAGSHSTIVYLHDATVGEVRLAKGNTFIVSGDTKVKKVDVQQDAKITMLDLTEKASIAVKANGIFTNVSDLAAAYAKYFKPVAQYKAIEVKENALWTEFDPNAEPPEPEEPDIPTVPANTNIDNSNLTFTGNKAYCPVCKKDVEWTAVTQQANGATALGALTGGEHFYLAENITYTGTADFLQAPSTGGVSCFHLNGKDLTATQSRVFFGYPGTLNVMGNGIVTGGNSTATQGATVQINTNQASGTINLYGGTYTKGAHCTNSSVISIWSNGGNINLYEGAKVTTPSGIAIYMHKSALCNSSMIVKGATIEGGRLQVYQNAGSYLTTVYLIDAKVKEVQLQKGNGFIVAGDTVIDKLDVYAGAKAKLGDLTENASITVKATGIFTYASEKANDYVQYFKPINGYKDVAVVDNCLFTEAKPADPADPTDPTTEPTTEPTTAPTTEPTEPFDTAIDNSNLTLTDGKAYCPVCRKDATWTAVTQAANGATALGRLSNGAHYYLAENIEYTGTTAFVDAPSGSTAVACFHLNGHNITSSTKNIFYGYSGTLNVMGNGTVTGANADYQGAAVNISTSAASGTVNLYGGTYAKHANTPNASVVSIYSNGGRINIYEGAKVTGTGLVIRVNRSSLCDSNLLIKGATVEGGRIEVLENTTLAHNTNVELINAKINEISLYKSVNCTVSGDTQIDRLYMQTDALITLGELTENASFRVRANGIFSNPSDKAADYVGYFKAIGGYKDITVVDNCLFTEANS